MNHAAETLVKRACPSIAYRIRREIWGEDVQSPQMLALQEAILADQEVLQILSLKKEDGWLGGTFHGVNEPESGIRLLMEKGVEPSHPIVQEALQAIIRRRDAFDHGSMERVGKPLDAQRLGGSKLMRAAVFAYAGAEHTAYVQNAMNEAITVFRYVPRVRSMADVCRPHKGKLVFKPDVLWPSIYHLRLLAATQGWRTKENMAMLACTFKHLSKLSPIPEIKLLHKGQIISPASIYMNHFHEDLSALDGRGWMMWFHRMELLARIGVAGQVDAFKQQLKDVRNMTAPDHGFFTRKISHSSFVHWSQYTGLRLEADWKASSRRINDLTFRWLLIQHYASRYDGAVVTKGAPPCTRASLT